MNPGPSELARMEEEARMVEATAMGGHDVEAPRSKDTNPKDAAGSNKPSYWNVPIRVLYEVGAALLEGALKYGAFNWRVAGVRTSVYIVAAKRHLDDYMAGEDIDPDSGLSHLTKAIAGLTVLRDAEMHGMVLNDDRPPRSPKGWMQEAQADVNAILERHPNPKPPHTEESVLAGVHALDPFDTPFLLPGHSESSLALHAEQTTTLSYRDGYEVQVMLPADDTKDGFLWMAQGHLRRSEDMALAAVEALRMDGYGGRPIRVREVTGIYEHGGGERMARSYRVSKVIWPGDDPVAEVG